jgi:gliding motility-associated-like protein
MVKLIQCRFLVHVFIISAISLFSYKHTFASHIVGGELGYTCLGNDDYLVTLKVYRDCYNGQAPFDDPSNVFIYNSLGQQVTVLPMPFPGSNQLPNNVNNPCLIVPPNICVEEAVFTYQVHLPAIAGGYKMIYQRCCRNYTIVNIVNPSNTGATYEATMPDSGLAICNSSPFFVNFPPSIICVDVPFIFDHSAVDPDGDSLVYDLCNPYDGANSLNPYPYPPLAYAPVIFAAPYTYADPMGGTPPMTIDPVSGLLTVTPNNVGQYVVGVCVSEYRNGNLLSVHRRDFQFNVAPCSSATASINGGTNSLNNPALFNSCDGFTFVFPNNCQNASTYHWDFGVAGATNDTSNLLSPTYTFPDTGVYIITLIANPGSSCGDTAYGLVYVYPILVPDLELPTGCEIDTLQFTDLSTASTGVLDSWSWFFGDGDTSSEQDPLHAYDTLGTFTVTLIVGTNLGCVDTISGIITINPKPIALVVPHDTLICYLDTIQLFGSGTGAFLWTPDYNIDNDTATLPLVSPDVTTTYTLTITNQYGCVDFDTVHVEVYSTVEADAGVDTTICPGGQVQLNGTGAVYFSWDPPTGLSSPNIPDPLATPVTPTAYVLTTSIGSCFDSDTVLIDIKPLPVIAAGSDQSICIGDSVMITGCCGTEYIWTPGLSLSDASISNPVAFPFTTTTYILNAVDSNSCPLWITDSVKVIVFDPPPLITTPDTVVYLGTDAALHCYGALYYNWTPEDYLDDPHIGNPVSSTLKTTTYYVTAYTAEGCQLNDSLKVTVVEDPLVVFPNAFTPNGDGINDFFGPVVLGIFDLESFSVFNRWGEMIYQATDPEKGWDGTHGGRNENIGTYVYMLSGKSGTTGKTYYLKGNVVLLR